METAINTPKVSFEDFYEVPNLKFDIDRLRKDLEIILKRKKIILYRQIKELEMEYDIGNLESDDFKNRRAELKSEVSLIIDKIKKK